MKKFAPSRCAPDKFALLKVVPRRSAIVSFLNPQPALSLVGIHIKAVAERLNPKRPMCYIIQMAKTRPLIKRTYRVVPLKDGTFAVEIAVTGTRPTTAARAFATAAEAEAWIVREKLK